MIPIEDFSDVTLGSEKSYKVRKSYPVRKSYSVRKFCPLRKNNPVRKSYQFRKRYPVRNNYWPFYFLDSIALLGSTTNKQLKPEFVSLIFIPKKYFILIFFPCRLCSVWLKVIFH